VCVCGPLYVVRGSSSTLSTKSQDDETARLQDELQRLHAQERQLDGYLQSLQDGLKAMLAQPQHQKLGRCHNCPVPRALFLSSTADGC
jgi:hypothetical protein